MKPETRQRREEQQREADVLASIACAGTIRTCPGCFKQTTITSKGRYRKHTSWKDHTIYTCPASGRYVVHNGVKL